MTGEELLEIIEPEWSRLAPGVARKLTKPKNRAKVIALLDSFLRRREAMLAEEEPGDEPECAAPVVARAPEPEPALRDEVRAAMYRFLEAQVEGGATERYTMFGYYDDKLVRTPDGWKITEMQLNVTHTEGRRFVMDEAQRRARAKRRS